MTDEKKRVGIPQAELVKELGLEPRHMTAIREKHLASEDWWKEGRAVMLSEEGEFKLRLYAECGETEPQLVPKFRRCVVKESLPNKNYVIILVDHGERGVLKEPCAIPRRLRGRNLVGKRIRVEEVRNATGVAYRHEELSVIK